MTQREKTLAAAVVGMLLLWGAYWTWDDYRASALAQYNDLMAARDRLMEVKLSLAQGREAAQYLSAWQQRSLPPNREVAQSLYRTWLQEQCEKAGLKVENIQANQRTVPAEAYTAVGYTVTARGTLRSLSVLLFEFYRSNLLQQITSLQLTPDRADSSQLSVTLQAEALILPDAQHDDLPDGVSERLVKASAEEYAQPIAERNLFAVYRPPRSEQTPNAARRERPAPPQFDAAKYAKVTGTIEVDGRWQAWITVHTTGEVLRVFAGDPVKVGLLEGRIVSVERLRIVIECDDQQLQVKLGETLRDGKALPKTEEG